MKTNKVVSLTLSYGCVKDPRCSFCYNSDKEQNTSIPWQHEWKLIEAMRQCIKGFKSDGAEATIAIEYSGHCFTFILDRLHYVESDHKTITTMHTLATDVFCGAVKNHGVEAISLSYDKEKVKSENDLTDYIASCQNVKRNDMKVGCNFLITDFPFDVPHEVLDTVDQMNFLIIKPTGEMTEKQKTYIRLKIEDIRSRYTDLDVVVDNCLAVQLGYVTKCKRGEDFVHILPDASREECCFKEDCYLYQLEKERKFDL